MLEYTLQTVFLLAILFVYMLSGSVVYSMVGEGYKATPLRCFSLGLALWFLLVLVTTIVLPIPLEYLWWLYIILTFLGLFLLPKKDKDETLDIKFFAQAFAACALLMPIFIFLTKDSLHYWQEFAIYGEGLNSLLVNNKILDSQLKSGFVYQLAILPVGFFAKLQDNIFACFNIAILAFVACEFVRNSGVKIKKGNIIFPLVVTFALLVVLNPFAIKELVLSANPFILVCAIGFAFSEYIFRTGFLPKSLAALPAALILILLIFSSIQGLLLGFSLFLVLTLRYVIQAKFLTYKQAIGYFLIVSVTLFMSSVWNFYLNQKGLDFFMFDIDKITLDNMQLFYKAMFVLLKQHLLEVAYILFVIALAIYRFMNIKKLEDIIVDKYLLTTVFWIIILYVFVCLPIFFSQYDYVARASYSLGFTTLALLQFIILMPIGRIIKELIDKTEMPISGAFKFTIILALFITFIMNKSYLQKEQISQTQNMEQIAKHININVPKNSKIAVVDINKMLDFYVSIANYKTKGLYQINGYSYKSLKTNFANNHKYFRSNNYNYILLHAPNNLLLDKFEYNLNPNFSYLYKIEKDGLVLVKKFDNKFYIDTNADISL